MTISRAPTLLYVLYSGKLFGTERMAIATLLGLRHDWRCLLLAPAGPALERAQAQGISIHDFTGVISLTLTILRQFWRRREIAFLATGVGQSLIAIALAALTGTRLRHLHMVHGGTDEAHSYGRKKLLLPFSVQFIAVSSYVRERLIAHGMPAGRIHVVENFLSRCATAPRRKRPINGVSRLIVVSRLDPFKRVDLLLTALEQTPQLRALQVEVLGTGLDQVALQDRALAGALPVRFAGFSNQVPQALAQADLLVHTCPQEPFGLVVLEAMAAKCPVLVPDVGGPSGFIVDGVNGFTYRAGDAADLARKLLSIRRLEPDQLALVTRQATATLRTRFHPADRIGDYRCLLSGAA